jgi:hypothetical protein
VGEFFIIVNPVKRQYLRPSDFGEYFKSSWVPSGHHAVATAMLICGYSSSHLSARADHGEKVIEPGSWYGDPIERVGDEELPNTHGVQTATPEDPKRNLYVMALAEFENVALRALAMLINERRDAARGLAATVVENEYEGKTLLRNLGDILLHGDTLDDPSKLEEALKSIVGSDWLTKYRQVCEDRPRTA